MKRALSLHRADVLIALTNGRQGGGRRVINLHVEDEATGHLVLDVDLTAEQLAALLGSAVTRVSGAQLRGGT